MTTKVLLICAQALLIQSISAQCIGAGLRYGLGELGYGGLGYGLGPGDIGYRGLGTVGVGYGGLGCGDIGYPGLGYGLAGLVGPANLAASNGAGLIVTSSSPVAPIGISVNSENYISGDLVVTGVLPFLGTVGLEGVLPTAGAGAVAYDCGNGAVGIVAEDIAASNAALGIGYDGLSYSGLGCGGLGYGSLGYGGIGNAGLGYGGLGYRGYGGCGGLLV